MKIVMRVVVAAFMVSLSASSQAQGQELTPEQAAQVIARVGDEVITAGEFARDVQFKIRQIEGTTGQNDFLVGEIGDFVSHCSPCTRRDTVQGGP